MMKKTIIKIMDFFGIPPSVFNYAKFGDPFIIHEQIIQNPKVIFDVGAFDGRTAFKYHKIFPSAKIFSFEPSEKAFNILLKKPTLYRQSLQKIGYFKSIWPRPISSK